MINRLIIVSILGFSLQIAGCCPFFYKPSYEGRVIDAETNEPVVGAVVQAIYERAVGGLSPSTLIVDIREVATDKDGIFRIPSKISLMFPLNGCQEPTDFLIYKAGYGPYPGPLALPGLGSSVEELFFSSGLGTEQEMSACLGDYSSGWACTPEFTKLKMGLVQIRRLKTKEEMRQVHVFRQRGAPWQEQSLLKKQRLLLQELNANDRLLYGK